MATQDDTSNVLPSAGSQVAAVTIPSLVPPVPQIVITQASPINRVHSTTSDAENAAVNISADESAAVPVSAGSSATPKQAELQCEEDSGEEFQATEDCSQCIVPAPESSEAPVPTIVVHDPEEVRVTLIERTESVESGEEGGYASIHRCCSGCRRVYYRTADALVGVYSLPLWLIILAIPVSAGFMGGRYMNECPGRSFLPILVFLLGIGGVVMVTAQICCIISSFTCTATEPCVEHYMSYLACIAGVFTALFLVAENAAFFTLKPDFRSVSPAYCHQTFYEYTRWMNLTVWLVLVFVLAVRGPVACIRLHNRHLE